MTFFKFNLEENENVMDQDTASSVTSVTIPEISGVENNIQLGITHQNLVDSHININVSMDGVIWLNYFIFFFNKTMVILIFINHNYETQELDLSNTQTNNTGEHDTYDSDTPIVNITEGI